MRIFPALCWAYALSEFLKMKPHKRGGGPFILLKCQRVLQSPSQSSKYVQKLSWNNSMFKFPLRRSLTPYSPRPHLTPFPLLINYTLVFSNCWKRTERSPSSNVLLNIICNASLQMFRILTNGSSIFTWYGRMVSGRDLTHGNNNQDSLVPNN